ncbi:DUF3040 domain-containing protein [Actinosynnema sp. ALI-1.44]|uniref:DUF3040 domain-containing protein n=1 Tax=Actinosynnema sp. ALI-1.44 TaxID=1933779 RepID=UPI001177F211|nr:DUF3040 domain-containing protein [Actinosynnema sp. ALI-1.44]
MLSPDERHQLHLIEKSLEANDPQFAARLRRTPTRPPTANGYRLAAITALVGMLAAWLGLLLFSPLLMFGGACLAISGYLRIHLMR